MGVAGAATTGTIHLLLSDVTMPEVGRPSFGVGPNFERDRIIGSIFIDGEKSYATVAKKEVHK